MVDINNIIKIDFLYNGNLGILQQKTIDNKIFCYRLLQNGIINRDEWDNTMQLIQAYFEKQIQKVIENPLYFVNSPIM